MIYRFTSKAAGAVIFMQPSGDQLLRIIGKEPAPQGIIEAGAMPAAIGAIEEAIAQDGVQRHRAEEGRSAENGTAAHDAVTLGQRAWPLVQMMRFAQGEDAAVIWAMDRTLSG